MLPRTLAPRGALPALCAGLSLVLLTSAGGAPTAPAAQARGADEQARTEALGRLKRVTNAFWSYWEDHREFPPVAVMSKDGKPLLSWRVLLLPYLGEAKLFREFKIAEPWDGPHNRKLLARMPRVFAPVRGGGEPHTTLWQVFTGPGTLFDGPRACRAPNDIPDGTSNTLLVVEAARAVPWTKPEDVPYDPRRPLPKLGSMFPGLFLFSTADGMPYRGRRDFPERVLRLAITRNDGTPVDLRRIMAGE